MSKTRNQMAASATVVPLLVDMDGIGAMCGVGIETVRSWRAIGILPPPIKLPNGRLLRWRVSEIQQLITEWAENPLRKIRS